jgi:uncharacterized protein (TIGR02996 family)
MSAPFTDDDKAFLRTILSNPAELTGWLVYADWLDERDDPRAEFVRLQARRSEPGLSQTERFGVEAQLEELVPALDPDWVAIFDRPRIENCDRLFAFRCPKKWENLTATDDPAVRYCAGCHKTVHYCNDIYTARHHARGGECVAVALGVPRRRDDLREPETHHLMGIIAMPGEYEPEPDPPVARRPWWKFW